MLARLDRARSRGVRARPEDSDARGADEAYRTTFDWYGLAPDSVEAGELAALIRTSAIREALIIGLDDWARARSTLEQKPAADRLWEVAARADDDPWRSQVRRARREGNADAARRLAEQDEAVRQPPSSILLLADALDGSGQALFRLNLLRQAHRRHPGDFWIAATLTQTCFDPELTSLLLMKEAVRYAATAVALRPDSADARHNLGVALGDDRQQEEAVAAFREALRLNPGNASAHNGLGFVLKSQGKLDEAIDHYREALRINPDSPDLHHNLALALQAQKKEDKAVEEFKTAIRLFEVGTEEARRRRPDFFAGTYNGLGLGLAAQGKMDEATAALKEAVRLDPNHSIARYNLASFLRLTGQPDEAARQFREAIRLKPDYLDARQELVSLLAAQKKWDEAADEARQLLHLIPNDPAAHLRLGGLLQLQQKLDEAANQFQEAIRLQPRSPEAHYFLGSLRVKQGRPDDAVAAFRQAVRIKPDYAEAHYSLGLTLGEQGKVAEAEAAYREALRHRPDYPEAHCNLGYLMQNQGRFTEALAFYRRGHELGSKTPGWSYPSGEWVKKCERFVALEARLPALLKGDSRPADAGEALELATVCSFKRLYSASARFSADAFAAQPALARDLARGHRYYAACYAALAGSGWGDDAPKDDTERARLRRQTLAWLRADLTLWERRASDRAVVQAALAYWQEEPDLVGVRHPWALWRLPQDERSEWRQLWADVDALRKKPAAGD
jgi:tetratricopeptide (TPR) repeat protein